MSADLALHVWFLVSGAIVVAISDDAFFSTLTDVNAKYARTYMKFGKLFGMDEKFGQRSD